MEKKGNVWIFTSHKNISIVLLFCSKNLLFIHPSIHSFSFPPFFSLSRGGFDFIPSQHAHATPPLPTPLRIVIQKLAELAFRARDRAQRIHVQEREREVAGLAEVILDVVFLTPDVVGAECPGAVVVAGGGLSCAVLGEEGDIVNIVFGWLDGWLVWMGRESEDGKGEKVN
jgi:hypothetical protein